MASSPAPTTPDNAPRRSLMNRSVTAPIRTSPATAKPPPEIGATEGVETLYTHPSASIVKFTTVASRPGSSSPSRQHSGQQALLPWSSPTERTVAAGPLQVYRVPGSVSFLNSGNLLHAILPRSQCWCVDGVSKFALRVLPDTYYRIELPGSTEEDREEVEKLKLTLQKVCHYERTPCPFERGFDVEIEDEADLDVRKKRRKSHGPAKKWRLDRQYSWKPEGWQPEEGRDEVERSGSSAGSEDDSASMSGREDSGAEERCDETAAPQEKAKVATSSRVQTARNLLEKRSATTPAAQLTLQSPPPSRLRTRVDVDGTVEVAGPTSTAADGDQPTARPRTFQAIPTDMPPSPPDSSAGVEHVESTRDSPAERLHSQELPNRKEEYFEQVAEEPTAEAGAEEEGEEDTVLVHDLSSLHIDDQPESASIQDNRSISTTPPFMRPSTSEKDPETKTGEPIEKRPSSNPPLQPPSTPPAAIPSVDRRQSDPFTTDASPDASNKPSSKPRQPSSPEDPFAAIQARILARRSIGTATTTTSTSFPPTSPSSSNSSTSSQLSRRSDSTQHHAFATAMVRKACSAVLGPPAHLVALMLRIAARFAKGTFGVDGIFYVESPREARGRVPGSYRVFEDGGTEVLEADVEVWDEDGEDDFGVPLRSPVRLGGLRRGNSEGLRERAEREWDVD